MTEVLFTTERSQFHQALALKSAPPGLHITMLRQPDRAELLRHLSQAEFWISERRGIIDAELIAAAPHLRLIQRLGSQTYDIDLNAARLAGVAVCEYPLVGIMHVAEHTIMQMLALLKHLPEVETIALETGGQWGDSQRTDEDTFSYNWSGRSGIRSFYHKTVGLLGFGEIGWEVARRLHSWGPRLLYNKRQRLPASVEQDLRLGYAALDALLAESDIVVNLLPYSPQTDHLLDAGRLARLRPGALLVSTGSGSVIDELAAADAIASGHLGGIAIDSYEYEPLPPDYPLIRLRQQRYNVLLTPHTAGGTGEDEAGDQGYQYRNILHMIEAKPLVHRLV